MAQACTCGAQTQAWWSLKPQVTPVVEAFNGQLVMRGDMDPVKNGFKMCVPPGAALWDSQAFCGVCQASPKMHARHDPLGLHQVCEHIYLATGRGKDFLRNVGGQEYVLPTMSITPSAFVALSADRMYTPIERVAYDLQHGTPQPIDKGCVLPLVDTVSLFERESHLCAWDARSHAEQDAMAGGPVETALARCLSGHELRERTWSIRTYGPALQELVVRRDQVVEVGEARNYDGRALIRRGTVEARDMPPWALYAVEQSRESGGTRLCGDCRRQLRDVVLSWFCQGC